MEIIPEPSEQQLRDLISGLKNKYLKYGRGNAVFSLRDGNITYTLLFCSEGLKLFGNYYNYVKVFIVVKPENMKQELKEILLK